MNIFLAVFALFLMGICAIVSSPVPAGWGKRTALFVAGVALWAGAIILARTNMEALMSFLLSDYSLTGPFGVQVVATLFVFGFGWFIFIASSVRTERKRATRYEQYWGVATAEDQKRVFQPWPSLLIWIPVGLFLVALWLVPVRFGGVELKGPAIPTATVTATRTLTATATPIDTPTATPTNIPTWTPWSTTTPIAMPEPTSTGTPTLTPTAAPTVAPTQTPDPDKPTLACNGVWLHEEPVAVGNTRILLELCADGYRFAAHEVDIGWDPIPTESMMVMPGGGARLEFYVDSGELLVNGQPFAEWLKSQGGR